MIFESKQIVRNWYLEEGDVPFYREFLVTRSLPFEKGVDSATRTVAGSTVCL